MKDDLKIFVEQNRGDFEHHKLNLDDAWLGIEEGLDELDKKSVKFPWATLWKVAAMFLVISTLAFGFYLNSFRVEVEKNGIALHNISADLADTEAFYTTQIDEKIELIKVTTGNVDPAVQDQMEILDEEYQSLKNDLKDNADSEEVINAMIEYYRLKLAMLEKILNEIEKNNDDNNHEEALAI